ncbi:MAG: hypothetical protein ACYTFH_05930 [Planctomycetota bacterium]
MSDRHDASDASPPSNGEAADVQRVLRRRVGVHRVSLVLRTLGWLAAVGCLLVGAAAAIAWIRQSLAAAGS